MQGMLLEADFMIHGIFKYKLFGHTFWITDTHIAMVVVSMLILLFAIVVRKNLKPAGEEPGTLQNIAELAVEFIDNTVFNSMDRFGFKYRNYIGTLFVFILISNISGLFGLRPPTADYGCTLALGLITFVIIQYNNIKYNKAGAFTDLFKPLPFLFPINLIGEVAVPLSLSLRLFGNVTSGTVIMGLIYGLLPLFVTSWGIPGVLHIYFDLFSGAIQTYVFCMLTMAFTRQKQPD